MESELSRRPRLLLIAYACNPYHGSEPGVGWNRALAAAREFDTWVLCIGDPHGRAIEGYLAEHGEIDGLKFVPVDKSRWAKWFRRIPGGYYVSYRMWQAAALEVARQLHRDHPFDVVHQATFCSYREPGPFWKLGPPLVWGPVGGTQNYPSRFLGEAGWLGGCREWTRSVLNWLQLRLDPRIRRTVRRAAAVLVANSTNQRDFERAQGIRPTRMLETGLARIPGRAPTENDPAAPLRLLWVGGLQPWKALPLLLKALARLPDEVRYQLRVVGDGPLRGAWTRQARRLGIDNRIHWLGRLPYAETLRQYEVADAFVFTSLRNTSGNVLLEALAAGLPVISVDHQGAHDMIDDECAVRIPVHTPAETVAAFADAIESLAGDLPRLHAMSQAAERRAAEFHWPRHGQRMLDVYRRVMTGPGQNGEADAS